MMVGTALQSSGVAIAGMAAADLSRLALPAANDGPRGIAELRSCLRYEATADGAFLGSDGI